MSSSAFVLETDCAELDRQRSEDSMAHLTNDTFTDTGVPGAALEMASGSLKATPQRKRSANTFMETAERIHGEAQATMKQISFSAAITWPNKLEAERQASYAAPSLHRKRGSYLATPVRFNLRIHDGQGQRGCWIFVPIYFTYENLDRHHCSVLEADLLMEQWVA